MSPDVNAGGLRAVDPAAVAVWRWESLVPVPVICFAAGILLVNAPVPALLVHAGALPLLAVAILVAAWYPRARYRQLAWQLTERGLAIQAGVFWRSRSFVARTRIQHSDVSQGPLERHYGVATLKLYTAGSHFARLELPGLAYSTAIELRDALQRASDDDAV